MKKISFRRNENGQVLGLPMYLIIIMIVAIAVIAAVIYMLPKGTKMMDGVVTSGSVHGSTSVGANNEAQFDNILTVTVQVTTDDDRRDPIQGATVRLSGGHVVAEDTTNAQGIATITVPAGAYLVAGINEEYMTMTIKASGYEDFEDDTAVLLSRSV